MPAPLPPLNISSKPLTEEQNLELTREERAHHIVHVIAEDPEIAPYLVKMMLDKFTPSRVSALIKSGFEKKVAEMQMAHVDLQSKLYNEVETDKMSKSEMLIRINNSEQAIKNLAGEVDVELTYKPFELNPDMPAEGEQPSST